jgi:hypothetical protein
VKIPLFVTCVLIISIAFVPISFAHDPDFEIQSSQDILKLCNFFYEEYILVGSENFKDHHKLFLNAKICPILYENIAWNSQHPQKNLVLISEIEKKLSENANYLKEKHLGKPSSIPKWFENKANLWIDGQIKNKEFLNAVEEISNSNLFNQKEIKFKRICSNVNSCLKENDYLEYLFTDNKGEKTIIKFEVLKIKSNEKVIRIESTKDVKEEYTVLLDKNRKFSEDFECCHIDRLIFTIPYQINDKIEDNFQVLEKTDHVVDTEKRNAFLADNQEGKVITIDKNTGAILSLKYHNSTISEDFEMVLIRTNIFENTIFVESKQISIPKWFKENTKWYLDEIISEKEFLNSIKYLIKT